MEMEQTTSEQTAELPAAEQAEQTAEVAAAKDTSGKKPKEKKQKVKGEKTKWLALVTYLITFLLFAAFAVIPADFNFTAENWFGNTVAGHVLPAVYNIAGMTAEGDPAFSLFGFDWNWNLFGLLENPINVGAWLTLLLAVVAVMSIPCLIVVLACKSNKPAAAVRAAALIEVCVLALLTIFLFYEISAAVAFTPSEEVAKYGWHWTLIGAYLGILVMLIVDGFAYGKHASGLAKVFVFILSAVTLLLMFNLTDLFNLTEGVVYDLLKDGLFGLGDKTFPALGENADVPALVSGFGIAFMNALLNGNFSAIGGDALMLQIAMFITVIMVFVNYLFDLMNMGMTTRKWLLVTHLVRYILEVVGVVFLLIMVFVNGLTVAIPLWVVLAVALVQLILNVIRLAKFASWKENKKESGARAADKADKKPAKAAEKPAERPERRQRREAPAVASATPANETSNALAAAEEAPVDYSVKIYPHAKRTSPFDENVVYSGPTDSFISTLSDCEKAEFAKVFLAERSEPLARIPEYKIGGENSKFFRAIFIYYGRVCDLVSDGLISKLYKQVSLG